MARFGLWQPLGPTWDRQSPLTPDIVCLHTMVGTLAGTDRQFRAAGYAGTFSHFGIGGDGVALQWQDTRYRGAANYAGNHRIISVETADMGPEFPPWDTRVDAVPRWTEPQLDTLAALIAAMCTAHGIPCELIRDSRPGRRGIGYHRQGCDGNYPDGRVPGGEVWSTARGKVCPGNARIAQIPVVISRARALLTVPPIPVPAPRRTVDQEDEMFIRCKPDATTPTSIALLSGPMFVSLVGSAVASAEAAIKAGATVLDVGPATWADLDRRSHNLCDNPRPVTVTKEC
jgi:hypothetical protein